MPNVATLLDEHVTLKCECLDRIYLNGYVPQLQEPGQLASFLVAVRGERMPSYEVVGKMAHELIAGIERMAAEKGIPVVHFERGQSKEVIAEPYFVAAERQGREQVVLIGIAQERTRAFRPVAKVERQPGRFGVARVAVFVNFYYLYIWDRECGRSVIMICSYAPWTIRVWLNGHSWLQRQLQRRGIAYESLDNGLAWVSDPPAMQRLADRFSDAHVQRYFDRWMYRLPSPFSAKDRARGYVHQLSVLQLEVSRTEVLDRPLHGRQFFEEVIRDQLDLGRPEKIQLIFQRRLPRRRGEGPFRTRVLSSDVDPTLYVSHRGVEVKQYWKCDRALRTETTINNSYDLGINKRLGNLAALRTAGRGINRRLLILERGSQHCTPAATTFETLIMPTGEPGRRAPGFRFGDRRTVALFGALSDMRWVETAIRSRELRPLVAHHLAAPYGPRQMAYDLRRLVRKGLLSRIPKTHRYRLTALGQQLVLFCTKVYTRILCRGIGELDHAKIRTPLAIAWRQLDREIADHISAVNLGSNSARLAA